MTILTLPYPISANRYWATRVIKAKGAAHAMAMTYVTPEAKEYKADCALRARLVGVTEPIKGRVAVQIALYPHRPLDYLTRMRKLGDDWDDTVQCIDLDNCSKVLCDALKNVVFEDDKWLRDIHLIRMEPDAHGARVWIKIRPYVRVPSAQPSLLPSVTLPAPEPEGLPF